MTETNPAERMLDAAYLTRTTHGLLSGLENAQHHLGADAWRDAGVIETVERLFVSDFAVSICAGYRIFQKHVKAMLAELREERDR